MTAAGLFQFVCLCAMCVLCVCLALLGLCVCLHVRAKVCRLLYSVQHA